MCRRNALVFEGLGVVIIMILVILVIRILLGGTVQLRFMTLLYRCRRDYPSHPVSSLGPVDASHCPGLAAKAGVATVTADFLCAAFLAGL